MRPSLALPFLAVLGKAQPSQLLIHLRARRERRASMDELRAIRAGEKRV